MNHASHKSQVNRLKRIHGQIAGLIRMVDEDRYCIEILTQLQAVRAALRKVEEQVLHEHARHCVTGALKQSNRAEREAKLEELMGAIERFRA